MNFEFPRYLFSSLMCCQLMEIYFVSIQSRCHCCVFVYRVAEPLDARDPVLKILLVEYLERSIVEAYQQSFGDLWW